jgi:hypothetical protein
MEHIRAFPQIVGRATDAAREQIALPAEGDAPPAARRGLAIQWVVATGEDGRPCLKAAWDKAEDQSQKAKLES